MAAGSRQREAADPSGFGKRGNVKLTPTPAQPSAPGPPPSAKINPETMANLRVALSGIPNPVKWAGGGMMAMALVSMLSMGSGGGLLSGLLGGMLAHRLLGSPSATSAPGGAHGAAGSAASTTSVTRGGFGATAGGSASS